jgi:hypothetical protein
MSRVCAETSGLATHGGRTMRLLLFAFAAGFSGLCVADPAAIQRCRQETDSLLRLRCYDAIPLPSTPAATEATRQPIQPAQGQAAPLQGAAAGAAVAPADPVRQFGLEARPPPQPVARPDAIESVIPGRFDGWVPGSRFRLANGQVWEIRDNTQGTYDLQDPKVRISRGVSGSFFMEVVGVSQTPRVRRVE